MKNRNRRLFFEALEERRMLATAMDDHFFVPLNGNVGGNAWENDQFSGEIAGELQSTGSNGSASGSPGGFSYSPNRDFSGSDSFGYSIEDSGGVSYGTVNITVQPCAVTEAVGEDFVIDVNGGLQGGVLGNDCDPWGLSLTASLTGDAANGSVYVNPDGSFGYTPDEDYRGYDSFSYEVSGTGTDSATVTILVDTAPVAGSLSLGTDEDTDIAINFFEIPNGPRDADGDLLTVEFAAPAYGSFVDCGCQFDFAYRPLANWHGTDTIEYTVSDGDLEATGTITIEVNSVEDVPVAVNDGTHEYNSSLSNTLIVNAAAGVLANDSDGDGDALEAVLVDEPEHGVVTLEADGSFVYTVDPGYVGSDSFAYSATDGDDEGSPATVSISVLTTGDVAIGDFASDGTDLEVEYTVGSGAIGDFFIVLFASFDGSRRDVPLQSFAGNTAAGTHVLTIAPEFDDLVEDYYLLAVVDGWDEFNETDEGNNDEVFAGGSYLLYEPENEQYVRIIDGGDTAEAISLTTDDGYLGLAVRDPDDFVDVSEEEPDGLYLDINGDGKVSQLDIDALAIDMVLGHAVWQNPINRWDVNGDGNVVSADSLAIINDVNAHGAYALTGPMTGNYFFDVNGDGWVSMLDAEQVIDKINGGSGAPAFQNFNNPLDVNDDDIVDIEDQLALIEYLNNNVPTTTSTYTTTIPNTQTEIAAVRIRSHSGSDHGALFLTASLSGLPVFFYGGVGDDTLVGGEGDDKLVGGDGDDKVVGGDGADSVDGGEGNDFIISGDGNDTINGSIGNDHLDGGSGDDLLVGSDGDDRLTGGDGVNEIHGGDGDDILVAGSDGSFISGGLGDDQLIGGDGDDRLDGGDGEDVIEGGDGDDTVDGGGGDDSISGGEGDDTIDGGDGNDTISGNAGDDDLYGGPGTDDVDGGGGNNNSSQDGTRGSNGESTELDLSHLSDPEEHPDAAPFGPRWLVVTLGWALHLSDANNDSRSATATLTDENGFTLFGTRDLIQECGSPDGDGIVTFPIFSPDTEFTLVVTVSSGLSGGGTVTFNSSEITWTNGYHYRSFDIESTLTQGSFNPQNCPGGTTATPNQAPVAGIANGWYQLHYGQELFLDGSDSSDSDDGPSTLEYWWDLNNDGIFDATGATATIPWETFEELGMIPDRWYTVTLVVDDGSSFGIASTELLLSSWYSPPSPSDYAERVGSPPGPSFQAPIGLPSQSQFVQAGPVQNATRIVGLLDVSNPIFDRKEKQHEVAGSKNGGPNGSVYKVKTLKGRDVMVWQGDKGEYWCHGLTVGGRKYSVGGDDVRMVLEDAGYYRRPGIIEPGDIMTWRGYKHSAIVKTVVRDAEGKLDGASTFITKNGEYPEEEMTLLELMKKYKDPANNDPAGTPQYNWHKPRER